MAEADAVVVVADSTVTAADAAIATKFTGYIPMEAERMRQVLDIAACVF